MSEVAQRLGVFLVLLILLMLGEWRWPRNVAAARRNRRWPVNLGFGLLDSLCLRLLTPWLAFAIALRAHEAGIGLFNVLDVPSWLKIAACVLLLDMTIYWQHRLMHAVPWLWRLHRLHHTDLALDASSGVRFHPMEILFSLAVKVGAVLLLGAPPAAVLAFEILLSSFSLFTHANIAIAAGVDCVLRWLVVTPDMHRIHHSVLREEHDRNFGFSASWWDRLFGSYRDAPSQPQAQLKLGLDEFREDSEQRFAALLTQPFRNAE
ncbi:MAG: sterol desaturase family protein [Steroidobacteraceae bacterium]